MSAEAFGLNAEVLMPFSMFQTTTSNSDLLFSKKVAKETISLIMRIEKCIYWNLKLLFRSSRTCFLTKLLINLNKKLIMNC